VLSKESQGLHPDGAYPEDDHDDDEDLLSPTFSRSDSRRRARSSSLSKSPGTRKYILYPNFGNSQKMIQVNGGGGIPPLWNTDAAARRLAMTLI
jgi:hypothetical protein